MTKRAASRGRYDREQSPEQRHAETRDRILRAAMEAVTVRGIADTSVEHVVRIAGVSRRTFYEHFRDLPQVLLDLHRAAANVLFNATEVAVQNAPADSVSRTRAGVEAFFQAIINNADFARLALQHFRGTPAYDAIRELTHARYIALYMQEIAKAHAAGLASRPADELTIYAIVLGMESVALRYLMRREERRLMEAGPAMTELMIRAFV